MKTKQLLFILFLICSTRGTLQAQEPLPVDPVKIDSLYKLINQSKDNKEKVRLLNEYARLNFYNQEYKTGLIATVDARNLATEIDFSGGEVMFHITVATFLGSGDLMEYHLRQARVLSGHSNEIDLYIVPTDPIGYPPAMDSKLIEKLNPVLSYFEKSKNKEIQAIIIQQIGISYYRQSNYEKVEPLQNKAIQLYTDLDQLYPLFLYHNYRMNMVNAGLIEGDKEQLENELKELLTRKTSKNQLLPFYHKLGSFYSQLGQSGIAIDYFLKSVAFFESTNNLIMLNEVYNEMTQMYGSLEMYEKQAEIFEKRIPLLNQLDDRQKYGRAYSTAVWAMHAAKRYDKAREYMENLLQTSPPSWREYNIGMKNSLEGQILMDQNRYDEALPFLNKSYNHFSNRDDQAGRGTTPWEAMHLATCYYQKGNLDKALRWGKIALEQQYLNGEGAIRLDRKINKLLYEIYNALGEELQAFKHLQHYHELVEKTKLKDHANLLMEAEVRSVLEKNQIEITRLEQEQILKEQQNKTQRLWIFSIAGALLSALLVAFILYRNNKIKQKANARLKKQKEEIQTTLEQLEAAQKQLIQSEKMASLGELTAGIAHEIQNPLNFVTNFSEVSEELIIELKEEIENNSKKDIEEILENINQNLGKINHHGKRASSIVKGMLDHSRTNSGERVLTDINVLADEYLKLAYHGLRAKDRTFSADFRTELDKTIPKISIIAQDFGRVILNLINNAFYAVSEKTKVSEDTYQPEVIVTTKKMDNQIQISVRDNGNGIPNDLVDKIFQPFFTTKPTGKGTGLGLSLSYDIVKAHGGEINVETKENKGTEFIITLPIQS